MSIAVTNLENQSTSDVKVSVVIPCFNQQHLLVNALRSVAEQNYSNLQVIVIDDGSEPEVTISENNWPFELLIYRQANQGLAAARNKGLQLADGELIKFLDADDILLPSCLLTQVASLSSSPDMASVIGFVDYSVQTNEKREIIPAFADPLEALLLQNIAPVHSYLFSKKSIQSIGGFCTDVRTKGGCEDYDLLLRLVTDGVGLVTVHKLGVVYYRYAESMSTQRANMQRTRAEVWSHTVQKLLVSKNRLTASRASALICGWWQLLCSTPVLYSKPLLQCRRLIISAINSGLLVPASAELTFLYKKLVKHSEGRIVAEAIARVGIGETNHLHIPVQAIVDRRLVLLDFGHVFNEEWLCEVFTAAKSCSGSFAIYGAGEIGLRLGRLLSAAGLEPECYIDKAVTISTQVGGVRVVAPSELPFIQLDLIIIASARFFNEIKSDLASYNLNFIVL